MKKIKFLLLILICSILLFTPTLTADAEASSEVYYPAGISDYVDLNNIQHFAINESKIFYSKNDNNVICYDKTSKVSTKLSTEGEIYNIAVEGDYVFIFASEDTYAYNTSTLEGTSFLYPPKAYNSIAVNYKEGKYYFAFIKNYSDNAAFEVYAYTSLTSEPVATFSYNDNIETSYSSSRIAFTENLIVLKPNNGKKIFLFEYPNSTLTPIADESSNPYHVITGFTDESEIYSMEMLLINNQNCIFLGYDDSTMVCEFNGSGLKFKSNEKIFNHMYTFNNELYAYSLTDANICKYSCDFDSLVLTKSNTFLAGKGSELGRFKDATAITYKSGNLYVTDSGNNRIQHISNTTITPISNLVGSISEVVVDSDNNYYFVVFDGTDSKLYKNNQQPVKTFSNTEIKSIAINIDNIIYALTSDGRILNSASSDSITLAFGIESNSKLRINTPLTNLNVSVDSIALNATFAVSVNNKINSINRTDGSILKTLTYQGNIQDFAFNGAYTNNPVYVLQDNGKITRSSFTEAQDKDMTIEGFENYSCFSLDIVSGDIQMYNTQMSAVEVYKNAEFSPSTTMLHYYQYTTVATGSESIWEYGEVKTNALIYDYYYFTGNYITLGANNHVIVLNASDEFVYVGYHYNNTLTFGYVKRTDMIESNGEDIHTMAVNEDSSFKLRTTNKNVSVFKYPTIFNETTIYAFAQGDIITTLGKYTSSIDNYEYYVVKIGNGYGYVCSKDVVLSTNISKSIRTNAKIKIFDDSEKVNVYLTNEDGSSIICQLPDGYKINVVDYDKNQKYTHITFIDEDQQEREGYILTSYVKMSGISTTVITAIVLLVLDVIIAVVVIVFYHHYKKKQKQSTIEK